MPLKAILPLAILFLAACAPQPAPSAITTPQSALTIQPPNNQTTQPPTIPTTQPPNQPTTQRPSTPTIALSNQPTIPLFDAHMHYSADSMSRYTIAAINSILDRAGIQRVLLSSTPNEGTLKLYEANPTRFVPEFRPYRDRGELGNWFTDPGMVPFVEQGFSAAYRTKASANFIYMAIRQKRRSSSASLTSRSSATWFCTRTRTTRQSKIFLRSTRARKFSGRILG